MESGSSDIEIEIEFDPSDNEEVILDTQELPSAHYLQHRPPRKNQNTNNLRYDADACFKTTLPNIIQKPFQLLNHPIVKRIERQPLHQILRQIIFRIFSQIIIPAHLTLLP